MNSAIEMPKATRLPNHAIGAIECLAPRPTRIFHVIDDWPMRLMTRVGARTLTGRVAKRMRLRRIALVSSWRL
jgi:hypothetical protein